jgi:hypothetical protein
MTWAICEMLILAMVAPVKVAIFWGVAVLSGVCGGLLLTALNRKPR